MKRASVFRDEIEYCELFLEVFLLYQRLPTVVGLQCDDSVMIWQYFLCWQVPECSLKQDLGSFTVLLPSVYFHLCAHMASYNIV